MNLSFKKLGLSPEDVSNMEKFGLPLNKRTKHLLQKIYQETNLAQPDEIKSFEKQIGFTLPKSYTNFLLTHNGGRPSKNVVNDDIVIDYFLSLDSKHHDYSIIEQYSHFIQFSIPIATTPNGDFILLSKDGKILFFDHEMPYCNGYELMILADGFDGLLERLS